ncbi:Shr3 amino acid permease chaperone [Sphaerosporella brunnea]|uniref:Shr3 amino acid permease chaperone n=1 Tax=Sphaerosporella brunnea TaxID=1250544 RepID=A0A5J5EG49_9PEZI|nr:Shr3 amino acid permease chaperone [Sphaerosporella brunnea]
MPPAQFATFLILCPTCFFLGILFTNWAYDHHTLWSSSLPSEAVLAAVETHYTMLAKAPPILTRLFNAVVVTGLLGFFVKLYRPSESNMLFDGSSLVLYMIGVIMYGTNVIRGLRTVESGEYGQDVGRVDTLRVMAATHVILALVLVGVLVLQAGQWYAERKQGEEMAKLVEEEEKERIKEEEQEGKRRVTRSSKKRV